MLKKYWKIGSLEANEDDEGGVRINDLFYKQSYIIQADILQDWIKDLTELYEETLANTAEHYQDSDD